MGNLVFYSQTGPVLALTVPTNGASILDKHPAQIFRASTRIYATGNLNNDYLRASMKTTVESYILLSE